MRDENTNDVVFSGYLARGKEDEKVMETWQAGRELHSSAMNVTTRAGEFLEASINSIRIKQPRTNVLLSNNL